MPLLKRNILIVCTYSLVFLAVAALSSRAMCQVVAGHQRKSPSPEALNITASASDPSLFLPVVNYASGGNGPYSLAVVDVNGDEKLDLVMSEIWTNTVSVLLGNGDGTFQAAVTYDSGGWEPFELTVGDVNGDGKADIVVANTMSGNLGVLLGNGDGTFQEAMVYESGGLFPEGVAIADLNGDGLADIVVGNGYSSVGVENLGVLLGKGDGTFQPVKVFFIGGYGGGFLKLADLNADGKLDVVITNVAGAFVLLGNGDGTFGLSGGYISSPYSVRKVTLADVNGDGRLDMIMADGSGAGGDCTGPGYISIFLGNGDGTFQTETVLDSGGCWPQQVAVADVNLDGTADLLVANNCDSSGCPNGAVGVMLGNGDGTFQPVRTYLSGGRWATSVVAADLNTDGKQDVAVANAAPLLGGGGSVGIFLNNTGGLQKDTTTSIASASARSVYGQAVTFTATTVANSGTPTGTTEILYGTVLVGAGMLTNGSVSVSVSMLPAGSDPIIASYLGAAGFAPSKSAALIEAVTKATTSTSLVSSLNPVGTNQSLTLTAAVTGQYGGAATGTVTFTAGSLTLGNAALSGNVASLTTSFANAGTRSISAHYNGDSNNFASTSATLNEKIIAATSVTLTSSLNPSIVGQSVTLTATVTSSGATPPNGETVTFYNGSSVLGTAPLNAGAAVLTTASLPAGIFMIKASYPGDSNFAPSASVGLRQVVNSTAKYTTATTLTSSFNPSIYGQSVMFTAGVTTSGPVPPTGVVVFTWKYFSTTYNLGTATLNSSGIAILTKSNLNASIYPVTVVYKGDMNNLASTSAPLNQMVLQTTSSATITSSLNSSTLGQSVTFTAKINSPTVLPTGPVTFTAGTTALGTVQLSGGKAIFTTSSLPVGSTVVKVTYKGNSNIKGSSAALTQVVQP